MRVCLPLPKTQWSIRVLQGLNADFWSILNADEEHGELQRHESKFHRKLRGYTYLSDDHKNGLDKQGNLEMFPQPEEAPRNVGYQA